MSVQCFAGVGVCFHANDSAAREYRGPHLQCVEPKVAPGVEKRPTRVQGSFKKGAFRRVDEVWGEQVQPIYVLMGVELHRSTENVHCG